MLIDFCGFPSILSTRLVCVSTPGQRVFHRHFFHRFSTTFHMQGELAVGRVKDIRQARHTYLTQRSYGVSGEAVRDV